MSGPRLKDVRSQSNRWGCGGEGGHNDCGSLHVTGVSHGNDPLRHDDPWQPNELTALFLEITPEVNMNYTNFGRKLFSFNPKIYRIARSIRLISGSFLPSINLPGIPGKIHLNDYTLGGRDTASAASYAEIGLTMTSNILSALEHNGLNIYDSEPILEIGCNYGRISRHFANIVTPGKFHVSDTLPEAVNFCAKEFGAIGWPKITDNRFKPKEQFGLVFLISVFTHLNDDNIIDIIMSIKKHIKKGGVLIFTTHGMAAVHESFTNNEYIKNKNYIERAFLEKKSHYVKYKHYSDDIGMSWHHPEYIRKLLEKCGGFKESLFFPAILGHQDMFSFVKIC